MDFAFSAEQLDIFGAVDELCSEVFAPNAEAVDDAKAWPAENVQLMADSDLMGIPVPEEHGGMGLGFLDWAVIGEKLSAACTTTGAVFGAHMLCVYPLMLFANDDQRKKYLTPLAKGEHVGAFGLTEPNAGSDAGNVQTRAEKVGDEYILNGSKVFITNAGEAQTYIVIANLNPDTGTRGLTAFIVEKGFEGFEFGKNEQKMAYGSLPNRELIFNDCRVPAENVLYKPRGGFRVALQTLDVGRIGMAIGAVGVAQAAFDKALAYSQTRVQFDKPICEFQQVQKMIADMAVELQAGRWLTYDAAWRKDQGLDFEKEAAMAKLYTSEMAGRVTDHAVQIHGGYGYCKEYTVERYFREAKLFEIVEGTSEIQRLVIANKVLKEAIKAAKK
ncbi:MAG TPA: acyl-CoA dehydrogenase family protein [Armatimonadota bacterium]|jgi:butyryl-CoA dehydrogenase